MDVIGFWQFPFKTATNYGSASVFLTYLAIGIKGIPPHSLPFMKWINDEKMKQQDDKADILFHKNRDEYLESNERGAFLRDLINQVEFLYNIKIL